MPNPNPVVEALREIAHTLPTESYEVSCRASQLASAALLEAERQAQEYKDLIKSLGCELCPEMALRVIEAKNSALVYAEAELSELRNDRDNLSKLLGEQLEGSSSAAMESKP